MFNHWSPAGRSAIEKLAVKRIWIRHHLTSFCNKGCSKTDEFIRKSDQYFNGKIVNFWVFYGKMNILCLKWPDQRKNNCLRGKMITTTLIGRKWMIGACDRFPIELQKRNGRFWFPANRFKSNMKWFENSIGGSHLRSYSAPGFSISYKSFISHSALLFYPSSVV